MVVGEGVVAASHVHDEDHVRQTLVIVCEGIVGSAFRHGNQNVTQEGNTEHYHTFEHDKSQELFIG